MEDASTTTIEFLIQRRGGRPTRPRPMADDYFQSEQRDSALVVNTSSPLSFCTTL